MAYIGSVGEYVPEQEVWSTYIERFKQFVVANSISDDKKVATLLAVMGSKTYQLLRSLTTPKKPGEQTYEHITKCLSGHFAPKPIVIAERFRFHKCCQSADQSINSYVAQLRQLTEFCEFGNYLDDALRDKFVTGLHSKHEAIQKRLLTESKMNFNKSIEIAVAMEIAAKDTKEVGATAVPVHNMHKVKPQGNSGNDSSKSRSCWRCTRSNHSPEDCFYKTAKCRSCGKVGHIQSSKVCSQSKKQMPNTNSTRKMGRHGKYRRSKGSVKQVSLEDFEQSDTDSDLPIKIIKSNSSINPIMISLSVEGIPIQCELDTGSAVSVISFKTYQKLFSQLSLKDTSVTLKTYTGELIMPKGVLHVKVNYEGQTYSDLELYVVSNSRRRLPVLAQKATCWWLFGVVLGCVEAVEAVGAIGWRWWRLESDFDNNG